MTVIDIIKRGGKRKMMKCPMGMSKCYQDCPFWSRYVCKFDNRQRKQLEDIKALRR